VAGAILAKKDHAERPHAPYVTKNTRGANSLKALSGRPTGFRLRALFQNVAQAAENRVLGPLRGGQNAASLRGVRAFVEVTHKLGGQIAPPHCNPVRALRKDERDLAAKRLDGGFRNMCIGARANDLVVDHISALPGASRFVGVANNRDEDVTSAVDKEIIIF
jgi:hypothetical protein